MPKKAPSNRPFRALRALAAGRTPPTTFADTMRREGTVPLAGGVGRVAPPRTARAKASPAEAPVFELESEDGWVEGYREGLAASVRRKLGGTPTSTLDLHRHDSDAARRRVGRFVARESEQGTELLLVIVGRGLHSPAGRAVLRDEIAAWLSSPPVSRHVLAFRTAPRELGGSGAVIVLLARHASQTL